MAAPSTRCSGCLPLLNPHAAVDQCLGSAEHRLVSSVEHVEGAADQCVGSAEQLVRLGEQLVGLGEQLLGPGEQLIGGLVGRSSRALRRSYRDRARPVTTRPPAASR